MKRLSALLLLVCTFAFCYAQDGVYEKINLWPDGAPHSNGRADTAKIIVYHPADNVENTGMAVVLYPGGGYHALANPREGYWIAQWLAEHGITGVVCNYRFPLGVDEVPFEDGREAVRVVRRNAKAWGVNPKKVGVFGSSAGGHLAAIVSAVREDSLSFPDFTVMLYPVITADPKVTNTITMRNLMKARAVEKEMICKYSPELYVDKNTPPALMLLSDDDQTVDTMNSVLYYSALKRYGIPAALYIFPKGDHGWGFKKEFYRHDTLKDLILEWLLLQM